jgi:uncharacterized protein YdhG (YjbR/CyaY superfamily)
MPRSDATTVDAYLSSLPADRRGAIERVREVVNAKLPSGYEEGMQYGMITWYVPLSRYPDTYNGQPLVIAGLASQKHHMAIYLNGVYSDPAIEKWFRAAFEAAGKKLDMGKSCVRFTKLDALPLEVIGETIAKVPVEHLLNRYDAAQSKTSRKKPSARKVRAAKTAVRKPAKQPPAKQPAKQSRPVKRKRR